MSGRDAPRRLMAAALTLVIALASCTTGAPQTPKPGGKEFQPPAIPITVAQVVQGTIAATLVYSGNVQSRAQVNVVPRITGRVDRLNVDIGDQIRGPTPVDRLTVPCPDQTFRDERGVVICPGEVIAELDRSTLESQVRQAEAGVSVAQARLSQTQAGAKPEDIAAAAASVRSAQ